MTNSGFSYFLLVLIIFTTTLVLAYSSGEKECVYTLYVKTGDLEHAGTDSKINLTLSNSSGNSVFAGDLRREWGLMGKGHEHDYFERGNMDIFSGRSFCIEPPLCKINLASNGKGREPAWYVEGVKVTLVGLNFHCQESVYFVNQWLSPESKLSVDVDYCSIQKRTSAGSSSVSASETA